MDTTANDWFDGSKNKNAILLLSKGGARQYTPQVWGFGGTGANAAYAWNTMNTLSTEFSIVVKNKVAYVTFAGVTKKMELEKDLYFGFGGENVNYTVTGLGYSTDSAVIESKIPSNAVVNTLNDVVIEDLNKANIVRSGALSAGMDAVAGEFVVEGKLDITSLTTANNPHVEFRLNGTDSNRFLLWDNEKKGMFKVSSIMAGKTVRDDATGNDLITFTAGNTLTLTWKIVVYNGDYYYYINNELRLINKQGAAVSSINLGMQGGSCKFYDMKAYIKSNDSEGFATQIAKIQSDVTAHASLSAGVHRV
jgi:hypothetical protein